MLMIAAIFNGNIEKPGKTGFIEGFNLKVFILIDNWSDDLRDELARNFKKLSIDTVPGILVVKDSAGFYSTIFDQVLIHHDFNATSILTQEVI